MAADEMRIRPGIVATYPVPPAVQQAFEAFADLTILSGETDEDRILEALAGRDVLLCTLMNRLNAGFIARLPDTIRLVATYSVGTDHIDLGALKARGLPLINTPDTLTEATADIAMLLLLGAARRAWEAQLMLREGRWTGWEPTQLIGADLSGRTLGILGFGRIGQAVAARAAGFGLKIATFTRRPAEQVRTGPHITFRPSMEAVLEDSDLVSLHLPLTDETSRWLDEARLARMKPGAILVNTARGGLIDEDALARALHSGQLAGAGLDVFQGEPAISEAIRRAPNTYLLPHIGSATSGARGGMGLSLARDTQAFLAGRRPACLVDLGG